MNEYIKNISLWTEVVREYVEFYFMRAEIDYLDDRLNRNNLGNSLAKYRRPSFILRLRLFFLLRRWKELGDAQIDAEGNLTIIKTANQKMCDLEDKAKEYYRKIARSGIMYGIDNPDSDDDIHTEFTSCYEVLQGTGPNGKTSNIYLKMTPKQIKGVKKDTYALLDALVSYLNKCEGSPQSHESLRWILETLKQQ